MGVWADRFRITHTINRQGQHVLQAVCPFHKLSDQSGCTKRLNLPAGYAEATSSAFRVLRFWCNQATLYGRQRDDMVVRLTSCLPIFEDAII